MYVFDTMPGLAQTSLGKITASLRQGEPRDSVSRVAAQSARHMRALAHIASA